jgi:hypothetical protein
VGPARVASAADYASGEIGGADSAIADEKQTSSNLIGGTPPPQRYDYRVLPMHASASGAQWRSGRRQVLVDFLPDVGLYVVAMRKAAFTIIGAFLIVGSAVQTAAASKRQVRAGRGHHRSGRVLNNAASPPSTPMASLRPM